MRHGRENDEEKEVTYHLFSLIKPPPFETVCIVTHRGECLAAKWNTKYFISGTKRLKEPYFVWTEYRKELLTER